MVQMMTAINRDNFSGRQMVTCWSCHHGRDRPATTPTLEYIYGPATQEMDDVLTQMPGQPSAESVQAAAEEAGLAFRFIPVISGQITMDNVEDQAAALDELEGPVFAYCRSGARCTNLYGLIQQQRG